ncbi:hypothetical protein FSP39_002349 [Pinctada imbricata]|uniref:Armadillo repeat-containing protein 6 n=1 Tax=Pinctada imbricata TaxID=66713 RepID=A0AA88Y8L7_PINIB|nr:hypothetical protein FSP39_002349 [Pinctada imbricata]
MAKVITQQTFDDVVRENMSEFDMSPEEAVADAVQQFESQGVNLLNIVKDAGLYSGDNESMEHPVLAAMNRLKISLDNTDNEDEIKSSLKTIKTECEIDLARRCMAGKKAYELLMRSLQQNKQNATMVNENLLVLIALTDGQPDLLDYPGMNLCVELLDIYNQNAEVLELVIRFIKTTCIRHEDNRQAFVKLKLINKLSEILEKNKNNGCVVKETCAALRTLTLDDDIRVPFGQAHEHAKMIVTEGNALKTILDICKVYSSDPDVLSELFATISKLVVRDEFCKAVMDMGGLELIFGAFQQSINDKGIVKQALGVTKALAGNDNVKIAVVNSGGIDVILAAMTKHQANAKIAELGCATIAAIVLRNPSHCDKTIESNGHHVILQAMKIHRIEAGVQKQACMAIRNLVARTREHCAAILELGAETLINEARRCHKSCADDSKAALRDLGCQVDLQELWKGEKPGLAQE